MLRVRLKYLLAPSTCLLLASCAPQQAQAPTPAPPTRPAPATQRTSPEKDASGFLLAREPYGFRFPFDHGAHRGFLTEWWYFTGHLRSNSGRRFGYQLTFFRNAFVPPGQLARRSSKWATREVMFAHFALCEPGRERFLFDDRIARASALPTAGADAASGKLPRVWLGDWELQFAGQSGEKQRIRARGISRAQGSEGVPFAIELELTSRKPPVAHGRGGVSRKGAGVSQASHYYSWTRLASRGAIEIGGEKLEAEGESWFDHEFGSSQISPTLAGWDWFSLQLSDGRELMLYSLRARDGSSDPASSGTLVERDDRSKYLGRASFSIEPLQNWTSPRSGARYPSRWKLRVPGEGLELEVTPALADQELDTRRSTGISYWEGLVGARGTSGGKAVEAQGYVELTGYARALAQTF